jgi:hypothetical protein
MLHHISIAVNQPLNVAKVLAEVSEGRVFPFPPHPGSYIVITGDKYGTAIEVLPSDTVLVPGESEVQFQENTSSSEFIAVHAAISVPSSQEEIEQIARREGWRVLYGDRGSFQVIEFWVENKLLLEFLPPAFVPRYLEFMQLDNIIAFAQMAEPTQVTA